MQREEQATHNDILGRIEALESGLEEVQKTLKEVTNVTNDIAKIWKLLKYAVPILATSILTNGIAGAEWGEIIRIIFLG